MMSLTLETALETPGGLGGRDGGTGEARSKDDDDGSGKWNIDEVDDRRTGRGRGKEGERETREEGEKGGH